jgi:hypothetical protein
MDIVPLIYIKDGTILGEKNGTPISIEDLFSQVEKNSLLYIVDVAGLEHGNPDFELYQRLTEHCNLWIDNGPRRLDDIMDTIFAGATNLTIRQDLWSNVNISEVIELTDDEVYFGFDSDGKEQNSALLGIPDVSGLVFFIKDSLLPVDFITTSVVKDLGAKHKIYLYNVDPSTVPLWVERGVTGIIVDLNKKGGYN